MYAKILNTFESKDAKLLDTVRRLRIMSEIPNSETEFRLHYAKVLRILREMVDTDNIVIPVAVEEYDGLMILELDEKFDGLNYRARINAQDYADGVVELFL